MCVRIGWAEWVGRVGGWGGVEALGRRSWARGGEEWGRGGRGARWEGGVGGGGGGGRWRPYPYLFPTPTQYTTRTHSSVIDTRVVALHFRPPVPRREGGDPVPPSPLVCHPLVTDLKSASPFAPLRCCSTCRVPRRTSTTAWPSRRCELRWHPMAQGPCSIWGWRAGGWAGWTLPHWPTHPPLSL